MTDLIFVWGIILMHNHLPMFFHLPLSRKKMKDYVSNNRKKPPVPTQVLPIYFKDIPSRVIDIESEDIFSELI